MKKFLNVFFLLLFIIGGCSTNNNNINQIKQFNCFSIIPYPPDNSTNIPCNVTLSWGCNKDINDITDKIVIVDICLTSVEGLIESDEWWYVTSDKNTYLNENNLKNNTTYYWSLIYTNEDSEIVKGPIWKFKTM